MEDATGTKDVRESARLIGRATELTDVVFESFSGTLRRRADYKSIRWGIVRSWTPREQGGLLARFSARCDLFAEQFETEPPSSLSEDFAIAMLRCRVVCEYSVRDSADAAAIEALPDASKLYFVETVASEDAFPYLREIFGSMAARFGLSPMILAKFDLVRSATPKTAQG